MSKRSIGETQEEYEKRLEKEEIEAKTGIRQPVSHRDYLNQRKNIRPEKKVKLQKMK